VIFYLNISKFSSLSKIIYDLIQTIRTRGNELFNIWYYNFHILTYRMKQNKQLELPWATTIGKQPPGQTNPSHIL